MESPHKNKNAQKEPPSRGIFALQQILAPLAKHWSDPVNIEEVAVCDPGRVFLKLRNRNLRGNLWKERRDNSLTLKYLDHAMRAVANVYGEKFNGKERACFSMTLTEGHRITCILGQAVVHGQEGPEGGIAIVVRPQTPKELDRKLADWGLDENTRTRGRIGHNAMSRIQQPDQNSKLQEDMFHAAREGIPILVSGETGTGKTSLLNLLLEKIPKNLRVVTVEDSRELNVKNPNRTHIMTHRGMKNDERSQKGLLPSEVIDTCVRLTPDVLALGEISTQNANLALELLQSGHSHFWTTIHAGSCAEAFRTFVARCRYSRPDADESEIISILRRKMIVIQLSREGGERRVIEVLWPTGERDEADEIDDIDGIDETPEGAQQNVQENVPASAPKVIPQNRQ